MEDRDVGTWGAGNFDSDTAADHLSDLTGRLIDEIEQAMNGDPVGLEPDEYDGVVVPCNLELLALLSERGYVGATLPPAVKLAEWKKTFLDVWERSIDGLGPKPEYKVERRAVLNATFDRLIALAEES